MFEIGTPITFKIGVHETDGVIVDTHPIAAHGGLSLLVQIAPEVFEIVYADEVVR